VAVFSSLFWGIFLEGFTTSNFTKQIYFVCAGLSYFISVLVAQHLSNLIGVLCVLVFMMFSGANPTLGQLKDNALIPQLLYYPSIVSLFRWSNELYYLIQVAPYHPRADTLALYSYNVDDFGTCVSMIILLGVTFRMLAYLVMVKQEE
jgi:hypothetical protein